MRIFACLSLAACFCAVLGQGAPDIQWKTGGHLDVRCLAYSPDGATLYTLGLDATVKVWRVSDGHFLRTISTYGAHSTFALSPDGTTIAASPSTDHKVKIIRVSDGALLRTLEPLANIREISFSPTGEYVSTVGWPGTKVLVWRVSDGQVVADINAPDNVNDVDFSPDGQLLAVAQYSFGLSKRVSFYQTSNWAFVRAINANLDGQPGIDFSPDSSTLFWCGTGGAPAGLWRVSDGVHIRNMFGNSSGQGQTFSPDGTLVAAGGSALSVWRASDGVQVGGHVDPQNQWFLAPVFAPSLGSLAVVHRTNPFHVQLRTPQPNYQTVSRRLVEFGNSRDFVALTPDGQSLVSAGREYQATRTRTSDGVTLFKFGPTPSEIASVSISGDGTTLLLGGSDIYVYNLATGALINTLPGRGTGKERVAFLPGGKTFVTGGGNFVDPLGYVNCKIYVRRVGDGAEMSSLSGHDKTIEQVTLSSGGSFLLTSSMDDTKVWSLMNRNPLYTLPSATGTAGFSPNASLVAIPAGNGIELRMSSNGVLVRTLVGATGDIRCATFTLDGTRIVAGCGDSSIRIWRVSDGVLLNTYDVETGSGSPYSLSGVLAIVMAPDGQHFYYGRDDCTLVKAKLP